MIVVVTQRAENKKKGKNIFQVRTDFAKVEAKTDRMGLNIEQNVMRVT